MNGTACVLCEGSQGDTDWVGARYVFGEGIPHLHVHVAPHRGGDALDDTMLKGRVEMWQLTSGATAMVSLDYPAVPEYELAAVAQRAHELLA